MDFVILEAFFMWCTILNGSLLVLWTAFCIGTPDLVYRIQNRWFPLPRETFNVVIYSFLGVFKMIFLFFNVIPYVVLLIIG